MAMYVSKMHADQRSYIGLPSLVDRTVRILGSMLVAFFYLVGIQNLGTLIVSSIISVMAHAVFGLLAIYLLYLIDCKVSEMGLIIDRVCVRYRGFTRSWSIEWTRIVRIDGLILFDDNQRKTFVGAGFGERQASEIVDALMLRYKQQLFDSRADCPISPPRLETRRLRLNPWREADFIDFKRLYNSPHIRRYNRYRVGTERALRKRFRNLIDPPTAARGRVWNWCILFEEDDKAPKVIGLFDAWFAPTATHDIIISYALNADFEGRGLMSEALRRMCAVFLDDWGVNSVRASVLAGNKRSIALLERNGFSRQRHEHETVVETFVMARSLLSDNKVTQHLQGLQ